ncbi:hypothetical protein F5148DRAFT_1274103 [Russula earlei]|uniref:Uncharacterized protein n=1 Tax=Russula earlei TaxID=71964 RepID=A0ACC0UJU0_9AGAM|nr:hypothetical protein F5148DRAFT_1274103 [Russula earlei]
MHFKHVTSFLPISFVKLFWERITASRIAFFYIIFSIINCILQMVFQAQAFYINKAAADFLTGLIYAGNAFLPGFFVLDSQLHFCDHVPKTLSTQSCHIVWNGTIVSTGNSSSALSAPLSPSSLLSEFFNTTSPSARIVVHSTETTPISAQIPTADSSSNDKRIFLRDDHIDTTVALPVQLNNKTGVVLPGFGTNGTNTTLDHRCLVALHWPVQTLRNTKREDFWVLGMSLVAVLNESIPHVAATVLTHLSSTAWGGFQIYNTDAFHSDFKRLTTDGACRVNLLPRYWTARAHAEIPSLAFNSSGIALFLHLLFGWQTFKRVGASVSINRIYKLVLTLSIVIQLSLFFVVLAVALWLDQLYNGAIAVMSTQSNLYQVFLMVILVLIIPWLLMGWFATRMELKFLMIAFLVLSALYLIGFGLIFDSRTFRWTYIQWGFFGATVSLSAVLVLVDLVVGIMCRLNFDKGLIHYLKGEEPLQDSTFVQHEPGAGNPFDEKFDFPSIRYPIPTFSATSSNDGLPLHTQMRFQTGPRFFNQSAAPFDSRVDTISSTRSSAHSTSAGTDFLESMTVSGSRHSASSHSSSFTVLTMNEPPRRHSRWVIE